MPTKLPTPKATSNPRVAAGNAAAKAEAEYRKQMAAGKVTPKNIAKVKDAIAKKYGSWPNGDTN